MIYRNKLRMIYCSFRTDDIQGFALIEKTDLFGRFFHLMVNYLLQNTAFADIVYDFFKIRQGAKWSRYGDFDTAEVLGFTSIEPFSLGESEGSGACSLFENGRHKDILTEHEHICNALKSCTREIVFQGAKDGLTRLCTLLCYKRCNS